MHAQLGNDLVFNLGSLEPSTFSPYWKLFGGIIVLLHDEVPRT